MDALHVIETGGDWLTDWGPKLDEKLDHLAEAVDAVRAHQMDQEVRLREVCNWMERKEGPQGDIARFYQEQNRARNEMHARVLRLEEQTATQERSLAQLVASHLEDVKRAKKTRMIGVGGGSAGFVAAVIAILEALARAGVIGG